MSLKKIISLILCAVMFCTAFASFAACNNGEGNGGTTAQTTVPTPSQTTNGETTGEVTTSPETDPAQTSGQGTSGTESQPESETSSTPPQTTPPSNETQKPIEPSATSGRFKMETGTSFDFYFDWKINGYEDGHVFLQVDVVLSTYQLYISARNNLGIITVNGESVRFSTEKIEQGESNKVDILLHSEVLRVKPSETNSDIEIKVEWFFNGSYNGVEFEWLEAGGVIPLS